MAANAVQWLYRTDAGTPTDRPDHVSPPVPDWSAILHYGSADLGAAPQAHQRDVVRLRDMLVEPPPTKAAAPADVLATLESGIKKLSEGETYLIYRDAGGFQISRSRLPMAQLNVPDDELNLHGRHE